MGRPNFAFLTRRLALRAPGLPNPGALTPRPRARVSPHRDAPPGWGLGLPNVASLTSPSLRPGSPHSPVLTRLPPRSAPPAPGLTGSGGRARALSPARTPGPGSRLSASCRLQRLRPALLSGAAGKRGPRGAGSARLRPFPTRGRDAQTRAPTAAAGAAGEEVDLRLFLPARC